MRASPETCRAITTTNIALTRLLGLLFALLAAISSEGALGADAATQLLAAAQRGDEARVLQLKTEFDSKPKPARGDKKTARALNEEALKLLRSGDFSTAIERLTAASKADSGDPEVLGNLGYAYLMIQRFSDAKTALERALELAPTRTATWGSLGEAYSGLGDEAGAITALRLAYHFSRNREKTIAYFTLLIEKPDASPTLIAAAKKAREAPELGSVSTRPAGSGEGSWVSTAHSQPTPISSTPVTRPAVGVEAARSKSAVKLKGFELGMTVKAAKEVMKSTIPSDCKQEELAEGEFEFLLAGCLESATYSLFSQRVPRIMILAFRGEVKAIAFALALPQIGKQVELEEAQKDHRRRTEFENKAAQFVKLVDDLISRNFGPAITETDFPRFRYFQEILSGVAKTSKVPTNSLSAQLFAKTLFRERAWKYYCLIPGQSLFCLSPPQKLNFLRLRDDNDTLIWLSHEIWPAGIAIVVSSQSWLEWVINTMEQEAQLQRNAENDEKERQRARMANDR